MDFIASAPIEYEGIACQCCEAETGHGDPIYVDHDGDQQGDGWRMRVRVQCAVCWSYVTEQVTKAKHEALVEAAQIVRCSPSVGVAHDSLMVRAQVTLLESAA